MSVLAKIIAVIILIVGLLVMLSGVAAGIGGLFRFGAINNFNLYPNLPGFNMPMMRYGLGLVLSVYLIIQGLLMFGFGLVIFLVADIARVTFETYRTAALSPHPASRPVQENPGL